MKTRLPAALLSLALSSPLATADPVPPPLLEFASGLPGKQVRLTWPAETGVRYRIERSTSLGGGGGGAGGWKQIALVEATSTEGAWLDPEPTTEKSFYRIVQPQPEVFSIPEPVLQPLGGDLLIHGQSIPENSKLVLIVDGVPREFPLTAMGGGIWRAAALLGGALPGGSILSAIAVRDPNGTDIVTLNIPITITETGRATDSPPALPPAAPLAASNPIPGIGVVVKKGSSSARGFQPGSSEVCDAGDIDEDCDGVAANPLYQDSGTKGVNPLYEAKTDLRTSVGHSSPLYDAQGLEMTNALYQGSARHAINTKGTGTSGRVIPASSGLPGEVSLRHVSLDVPCPAGPGLSWICTYRSKVPVESGLGAGWDFSYNISIEPVPLAAGATAPQVIVRDGGGRADVFHRQPDGSYRCDGMFREGRFDGDVFTLTFASTGRWVFRPLDGSPAAGKIASIVDRNEVALACAYDSSGQLTTVSDAFGRSLAVEWGSSPPRILSVTAQATATSFNYAKVTYTYTPAGRLSDVSAPFVPGEPPVAGATAFTYSDGLADPNLNGNLLTVHDGAGRLLEGFEYSTVTDPLHPAYDTCAAHDRHRAASTGNQLRTTFAVLLSGEYEVCENDELGRVTVRAFNKMHRLTRGRSYTGFATPDTPVTSASLPNDPATKLRASDPAFFESTCTYNADGLCTRITHPDGSRQEFIYDRDFRPDCPVLERGNARVMTLVSSSGEKRTVRCDYLPGYGAPEAARPGNPIGGLTIKGGKNPGGNAMAAGRERGITINTSHVEYATANKLIWSPRSNFADGGDDDCDGLTTMRIDGGMPNRISMNVTTPKQTQGQSFGSRLAGGEDEDCDGSADDAFRKLLDRGQAGDNVGFTTRMVTAHGQSLTWEYDVHGNCTAAVTSLPMRGTLYQYVSGGRCSSIEELNGPGSSFLTAFTYHPTSGFVESIACDSAGLNIASTFERDPLGRITRTVDALGNDWLFTYNPLGQCVTAKTPEMPNRISMNVSIDAGGRVVRCDCDHLLSDGSPDPANPAYSTFHVYDSRARLVRIAAEERPVDASGVLTPDSLGIDNFAVCDFTYDDAGQCVRVSTPAACRGQATDLACDFTWDERGLIHRCIEGGAGQPSSVTTECDYDVCGALVRSATVATGLTAHEWTFDYDGFHRPSSIIDPMGNETTLGYDNDGTVTRSFFGEVNDVPGSAGNVLLSSLRLRKRPEMLYEAWDDTLTERRRVEVLKSNKQGDPNANRTILKSYFQSGDKPTQAQRGTCPPTRPVRCPDGTCAAFFGVDVEDDTLTQERFRPGSVVPHQVEITVVDRSPAGLVNAVTLNGDTLLTCTYDTAGRLATTSNGATTVARTRDKGGNILVCGETDHFRIAGMPDKTFTITRSFDALGRCLSETDGIGNSLGFAWDSLGRCVSVTAPDGLVTTIAYDGGTAADPFGRRVAADLDADGKPDVLASSLARCGETLYVADSYGHRTSFVRDALGRVTRCDHPDSTHEECRYDEYGKASGYTRKSGAVVACDYDRLGRVTSISYDPVSLPADVVFVPPTIFVYNGLGACVRCEQGTSVIECTWDSLGNPLSETQGGRTVTRTFNHRGRTGIDYPDGRRFAESRDALGQLLSVSTLNAAGVPDSPPVVVLEYAGQRVWRSTQANGIVTTWTYRGDGPVAPPGSADFSFDSCTDMTVRNLLAHELAHVVQQRDRNQRISARQTLFTAEPQGPGRMQSFTRDALGRITGSITRRREALGAPPVIEESVTYTLGKEGRRIQELRNSVTGDYTQSDTLPPGDQQMDQYTTWPGGDLEWDDDGNLHSLDRGSVTHTYQYDAAGRLVLATDTSGSMNFAYDALGRRVSSTTTGGSGLPPVTTEFVYDGDACVQEWGDDGTGTGTIDAAVTFAHGEGIKYGITTRDGTVSYPVPSAAAAINYRTCSCPAGYHVVNSAARTGPRVCTCPPGYYISAARNKIEHWGDPHENLNGRFCPGGDRMWPKAGYFSLMTNATGAVTERFDCDDAGKPVFLAADGLPTGSSSAIGPIRWMAPEAMWEPSIGMLLGPGTVYCPDLGMTVAQVQDHNSSRSNKSSN